MRLPAPVRIRRMSAGDVERVVEIAAGLPDAPHWPVSAYLEAMDRGHRPRRVALVADGNGGRVVGLAVANLVAPEAELETIAVAAEGQRQGVGAGLMRALMEELKAERVTELLLEVRASNKSALGFYRALGFLETGRRVGYYADPEEDAVLMRFRLERGAFDPSQKA